MVEKTFKNIAVIQTSSLHKGVPGSKHNFQPVLPGVDKVTQLQQVSYFCALLMKEMDQAFWITNDI